MAALGGVRREGRGERVMVDISGELREGERERVGWRLKSDGRCWWWAERERMGGESRE